MSSYLSQLAEFAAFDTSRWNSFIETHPGFLMLIKSDSHLLVHPSLKIALDYRNLMNTILSPSLQDQDVIPSDICNYFIGIQTNFSGDQFSRLTDSEMISICLEQNTRFVDCPAGLTSIYSLSTQSYISWNTYNHIAIPQMHFEEGMRYSASCVELVDQICNMMVAVRFGTKINSSDYLNLVELYYELYCCVYRLRVTIKDTKTRMKEFSYFLSISYFLTQTLYFILTVNQNKEPFKGILTATNTLGPNLVNFVLERWAHLNNHLQVRSFRFRVRPNTHESPLKHHRLRYYVCERIESTDDIVYSLLLTNAFLGDTSWIV